LQQACLIGFVLSGTELLKELPKAMDRIMDISKEFRGGCNYSLDVFIDAYTDGMCVLSALWCRLADAVEEKLTKRKSSPVTESLPVVRL
jgi:hypothetical protein